MAPFKAYSFNQDKIGDLSKVITPPYDVIPPQLQQELHEKNPHSIIKIDYGVDIPGDDKYQRAARLFNEWTAENMLVQDSEPAIYIAEQEFLNTEGELRRRRGFIALLRTEDFGTGYIYPHEKTFPKHKVDRLNLIRAAHIQLNPIFTLYSDTDGEVYKLMGKIADGKPDAEFTMDDGTIQRMWKMTAPADIAAIVAAMKGKPVYIADGHHRYDTSRNFLRETEKRFGSLPEDHPARFCLVNFTAMEDPGLELTSPHRVLKGLPGFTPEKLLAQLSEKFDIEKSDFDIITEITHADGDRHIFALQIGSDIYRLTLKQEAENSLPPDIPAIYNKLDTSVCTYHMLHPIVGGPERILDHVLYIIEHQTARKMVESGEGQACIYVSPNRIRHITEVVAEKEVFPQKSTYFYPKLVTGLVIYRLDME